MEKDTALIVLDKEIVSTTKIDQAAWILGQADTELGVILREHSVLSVSSDDEKVSAEQSIMAIRKFRKSWDSLRKEWGHPLDLAKKTVDSLMRQRDEQAEGAEKNALRMVQDYTIEQARIQRAKEVEAQRAADEANRILREAHEKEEAAAKLAGEVYKPVGIPEVIVKPEEPHIIPKAQGISYRRVWMYRVEDESKIPDAYTKRVIDDEAIKRAISVATRTVPDALSACDAEIPGIVIFNNDRPIVRG